MGDEGVEICLDIREGGLWAPMNPLLKDGCGEGNRLCGSIGEGTGEAMTDGWRCIWGEGMMTERRDGVGEGCRRRAERGDILACLIIMAVGVGIEGRPLPCCCGIIIESVIICCFKKTEKYNKVREKIYW